MGGAARILCPMKRAYIIGILVLAFCGLADSVYILQHEISSTPLICDINNLSGCNAVVSSSYSYLLGIPLAAYGAFFYGVIFFLAALELVAFNQLVRRLIQGVSLMGVIASLYFTLIQIFVIDAFCIYCLVSAAISLFIAICAGFIEPLRRTIPQDLLETRIPLPPAT